MSFQICNINFKIKQQILVFSTLHSMHLTSHIIHAAELTWSTQRIQDEHNPQTHRLRKLCNNCYCFVLYNCARIFNFFFPHYYDHSADVFLTVSIKSLRSHFWLEIVTWEAITHPCWLSLAILLFKLLMLKTSLLYNTLIDPCHL